MRLFASNRRLVPSSATLAVLLALPLLSSAIALGMPAAANHEVSGHPPCTLHPHCLL